MRTHWENVITSKNYNRLYRCECHEEYWSKSKKGITLESLVQAGKCFHCGNPVYTGSHPRVYDVIRGWDTTGYRKATVLCELWLDKYEALDKKYPHGKPTEACREYGLQDDIQVYYETATHEKQPDNKVFDEDGEIIDSFVMFWDRVFEFAIANEADIVKLLSSGKPTVAKINPVDVPDTNGQQLEMEFLAC